MTVSFGKNCYKKGEKEGSAPFINVCILPYLLVYTSIIAHFGVYFNTLKAFFFNLIIA